EQGRAGDRLVTQLFAGVGGVRNQLADEDLLVGIDRMDDQVEELGNIGLERPAFLTGLINEGHGRGISPGTRTKTAGGAGSTRPAFEELVGSRGFSRANRHRTVRLEQRDYGRPLRSPAPAR